jgi:hypothetical protein
MDQNDRRAIDDLFAKLQEAERQSPPRDTQAEAYIADLTRRQPAAPYLLAQAVIVQEYALNALNQRVQELEAELARRPPASAPAGQAGSGGFLGGLFGGGQRPADAPASQPRAGSVPTGGGLWNRGSAPAPAHGQPAYGQPPMGQPGMMGRPMQGGMPFGGGQRGGFLGGALGTVAAVAGGVLLGNAMAGMFSGGAAEAAQQWTPAPEPAPEPEPAAWEEPAADFGGEEEF